MNHIKFALESADNSLVRKYKYIQILQLDIGLYYVLC